MDTMLRISEADAIALHGLALLAGRPGRRTMMKMIAETLEVSPHHLYKVMERLKQAGLVWGTPGPWGGYKLAKPSNEVTLLEIYEAMEGKLRPRDCLMENRVCRGRKCVLGDLLVRMNREFRDYLAGAKLSEFKHQYPVGNGGKHEKKHRKH